MRKANVIEKWKQLKRHVMLGHAAGRATSEVVEAHECSHTVSEFQPGHVPGAL